MKILLIYKFYNPHLETFIDESIHVIPECWQLQKDGFMTSSLFYKKMLARLMLIDLIQHHYPPFSNKYVNTEVGKLIYDGISTSISYSDNMILAAASAEGAIGIDVEKLNPIDLHFYETEFASEEQQFILNNANELEGFYTIWTRKEAVLKADGRGLFIELPTFSVTNEFVKLSSSSQSWNLTSFRLLEQYLISIAGSEKPMHIQINESDIFNDLV